jgi:alanine racemase
MHKPLRLSCSKDALAANWRWLADKAGVPAGAAIKANGYGLGASEVSVILAKAGCRDFFVSSWFEAVRLPMLSDSSVVVLHGAGPSDMAMALQVDARPVLNTMQQVHRWKEQAAGRPCDVMIDTGMNRLGLRPDEIAALEGLTINTLHSHLACADEDGPESGRQLRLFQEVSAFVRASRYSLANSAGILLGPKYAFDLVRPGLALYGGIPRTEARGHIRPVATLEAQVIQRRVIRAGEGCGYGGTYRAERDTEAAVINIGYADGYWRGFSGKGSASVDGVTLPVLGRVSMDLVTLSCAGLPSLAEGDWVTLNFELESASECSGMSQYELLTGLGDRFDRVWH